jgi:hypothetical protein
MHKYYELTKALIRGNVSVNRLDKTSISRTPGDVTDVVHN